MPEDDFYLVLADDWAGGGLITNDRLEQIWAQHTRPIDAMRAIESEVLSVAVGALNRRFSTHKEADAHALAEAARRPGTRFYVCAVATYAESREPQIHHLGVPF